MTESKLVAQDVRLLAGDWVKESLPEPASVSVALGLPEWDDRLNVWRISLILPEERGLPVGEIQVGDTGQILRGTEPAMVEERLRGCLSRRKPQPTRKKSKIEFAPIPNKVILGDCRSVLSEFPPESVQLVFTSPPYFNAKPECAEYVDYPSYLDFLGESFSACHSILAEGRFLVVNVSPVLVRRTSRNTSSKRLPIPFDLHPILDKIGFQFIDDIIWKKPEGAGWHLGRGRRFAADRQPLQYKPVTVTEYVLVYRKKTDRLIDWNLRNHSDQEALEESKIFGEYDITNIWDIKPSNHKLHPAVFPDELAKRIIKYYSIRGDIVLDPFAGTGVVGRVANSIDRGFVLVEKREDYFEIIRSEFFESEISCPIDFDDIQYYGTAEHDTDSV